MTDHVEIRSGAYADSVTLLQVSRDVSAMSGVETAAVAMATPLNLDLLAQQGFAVPETTSSDMVVAVRVSGPDDVAPAVAAVDAALTASTRRPDGGGDREEPPRTTATALSRSGADLAVISVPGEHAFIEAMDALAAGRDVMVFSDNVSVEHEVLLKRRGARSGLLVMGPDCGTAMVGGIGLGFANVVTPGPVGIVAASGTGCQHLMTLLDQAGIGVRAALGVGGRDLSDSIGGLGAEQALRILDGDEATELIVVVSKPPDAGVADRLQALSLATPVRWALLGDGRVDITQAAEQVIADLGGTVPSWQSWGERDHKARPGWLRGLYSGGTLADEAMLVAGQRLGPIRSNIPLSPELALDGSLTAPAHLVVDYGDDQLTQGRPHPMIDQSLRLDHLARHGADQDTAVVLLDVVLGHGSHPDPAAELAPALSDVQVPVVVALVGTGRDPQGLDSQADRFAAAGAAVFTSNAEATRYAMSLVEEPG